MSLNIEKTKCILFNGNLKLNNEIAINIDNNAIDCVQITKFLGVFIDNQIQLGNRISTSPIEGKILRGIGILYKMQIRN